MSNIVETAKSVGFFKTFVSALDAAGLGDALANAGPFTILAPTDQAFAKFSPGSLESLLHDTPRLKAMLANHIIRGKASSDDAVAKKVVTNAVGVELPVRVEFDGIHVAGARVVEADLLADNGVIHAIDAVLLPKAA